ncbi:DNA polymerase III, alpha subunit [Bacillus sp. TS-2]|nr:DNA polymerase III, alpha subunit [Bacillus sp. TS-2]
MKWVQTNVYSEYSLLSSTNRIDDLVKTAKSLGYEALALTDHHVMYGVIPFYEACLKYHIKPLLGLEVTVMDDETGEQQFYTKRLIAKSEEGYRSLIRIASVLGTKNPKESYLTKEEWLNYVKGCVIILPFYNGGHQIHLKNQNQATALQWIKNWTKETWLEDTYIELNGDGEQESYQRAQLIELAKQLQVKYIPGRPLRFLSKEDRASYLILKSIKLRKPVEHITLNKEEENAYFISLEKWQAFYSDIPNVTANMDKLIKSCQVTLEFNQLQMPQYPLKEGNRSQYLRQLCEKGLKSRYPFVTDEIFERLEHELQIIQSMGFEDYFLVVWDFVRFAKEQNILVGPGRGSAAGSLVAYLLAITEIDPIEYQLLFERFLNPERKSLPDIDIDFPDHRREEVIEYVQKKYGEKHVAQIMTFGTFAARAAIRDVGKALGVHAYQIEKVAKMISSRYHTTIEQTLEQNQELVTLCQQSKEVARMLELAHKIEGLPRHVSTHAAGVIISKPPITQYVALQNGGSNVYITQAPMEVLEKLGFVKFDFLGLRNLTVLENMNEMIYRETGEALDFLKIPLTDSKVYELLAKGETTGIFQLESPGMRKVLRQLGPKNIEDIVAVNALYRPGPMDFIPNYIEGKNAKDSTIHYIHPDLESILGITYGVVVYQEQIMQIAVYLAGYSLAEADLLRRAISKKNRDELLKEKQHFIMGAKTKGYSSSIGEEVFKLIERFANYGFNRSHAVAYSFISYQLAYVKVHFPAIFYAALLSSAVHQSDKLVEYLEEVRNAGIRILPPSLEKSGAYFTVEERHIIRTGYLPIDHIGLQAAKELLVLKQQETPKSLFEFCVKVNLKIINRRMIENLIKAGALDFFEEERATMLATIDEALEYAERVREFEEESAGLFTISLERPNYIWQEPLSDLEKLEYEFEVFGFYLSGHPIEKYETVLESFKRTTIEQALKEKRNLCRIAVLVVNIKQIKTKKGEYMAFIKMSDETRRFDGVVFPKTWKESASTFKEGQLLLLEGKFDYSKEDSQFIINKAKSLDGLTRNNQINYSKGLFLKIPSEIKKQEVMATIHRIVRDYHGHSQVIVVDEATKKKVQLHEKVNGSKELIKELEDLLGIDNVVFSP